MEEIRLSMDESVRFVVQHYRKGMFDTTKGWKKLTASLPGFGRVHHLSSITRVAVAMIFLFIVGIGLLTTMNRPIQLTAQNGTTEFTLPDQTEIVMQEGAKLKYDRHFGKTDRHVSMQGEIAFTVTHDETRPFVVSTPTAQIEVLGTVFIVNADDNETRLSVTSGLVRFTPDQPAIPLLCSAGTSVHYNAGASNVLVTSTDSGMEINSKRETLTFNNMKLKEIVAMLSHFYHVQIELPESESEITFSSSFTQTSIIEIIHIINFTLDTHITLIE